LRNAIEERSTALGEVIEERSSALGDAIEKRASALGDVIEDRCSALGDAIEKRASALGEETDNPRRNIPFAIAGAVAFTGVFYVFVMFAQSLGFGLDANGVKAFSTSGAPLGDLSTTYIDKGFADAVEREVRGREQRLDGVVHGHGHHARSERQGHCDLGPQQEEHQTCDGQRAEAATGCPSRECLLEIPRSKRRKADKSREPCLPRIKSQQEAQDQA